MSLSIPLLDLLSWPRHLQEIEILIRSREIYALSTSGNYSLETPVATFYVLRDTDFLIARFNTIGFGKCTVVLTEQGVKTIRYI